MKPFSLFWLMYAGEETEEEVLNRPGLPGMLDPLGWVNSAGESFGLRVIEKRATAMVSTPGFWEIEIKYGPNESKGWVEWPHSR